MRTARGARKSVLELSGENALGLVTSTCLWKAELGIHHIEEVCMSLQVPPGNKETDRHVTALARCAHNLALQKFRSPADWIFRGVYDFVLGTVRQSVALSYLGLKIPRRIKKRVEIWFSDEQRQDMSRGMAEESEQQLCLVRRADKQKE